MNRRVREDGLEITRNKSMLINRVQIRTVQQNLAFRRGSTYVFILSKWPIAEGTVVQLTKTIDISTFSKKI